MCFSAAGEKSKKSAKKEAKEAAKASRKEAAQVHPHYVISTLLLVFLGIKFFET